MNWNNYPLDELFVGRNQELDQLARALLAPNAKLAAIVGAPGSGKTALAMQFARTYANDFRAGFHHIKASPLESLKDSVDAQVSHPTSSYLLVLDELESLPGDQRYRQLNELRQERPAAQIICITRDSGWAGDADLVLQLGGLNKLEANRLFRMHGLALNWDNDLFTDLNPRILQVIADFSKNNKGISPVEVLKRLKAFTHSGLIGLDGRPLSPGTPEERQIVTDLKFLSDDLLSKAYANPNLLYEISARRFEEFVAEILHRLGYEVSLTPSSKDGGKDIYAAKKDDLGSFLYIVECKRYSPENKVGVGLIRELTGVVNSEHATAGILATTSFFTKGAKEFQQRLSHQISLKDYLGLQDWMSKALGK